MIVDTGGRPDLQGLFDQYGVSRDTLERAIRLFRPHVGSLDLMQIQLTPEQMTELGLPCLAEGRHYRLSVYMWRVAGGLEVLPASAVTGCVRAELSLKPVTKSGEYELGLDALGEYTCE